ncbi:Gfo/Idh/MocA family oxidoreductase [Allocoprobacillus halotolerans]|uniref:Gfo/Idh/MocA family oxidoreductase n=1 Tax=Allocoprobacillus halotolerans TaxID=2944914 RepID=A0ABY5I5S0_9FIRM|nr:Gfo/Idh/MocA family oxidoreductase [Allocoprobacillus halotolerans]UTY40706.1 Gfo/Idh/MocA family oxidoreductase [Allocoprobacillus halotolerans]
MLAKKYGFQRYSTNYQDLLKDSQVDTIYIALPNHLHYEYAKQALEHQKHVIIEKPMASTYKEAKTLQTLAIKNHLLIWEAITNQYLSQYVYIKKILNDIGNIQTVTCQFCQYSSRYDAFLKGKFYLFLIIKNQVEL